VITESGKYENRKSFRKFNYLIIKRMREEDFNKVKEVKKEIRTAVKIIKIRQYNKFVKHGIDVLQSRDYKAQWK
jgi:hypothetical protein